MFKWNDVEYIAELEVIEAGRSHIALMAGENNRTARINDEFM